MYLQWYHSHLAVVETAAVAVAVVAEDLELEQHSDSAEEERLLYYYCSKDDDDDDDDYCCCCCCYSP